MFDVAVPFLETALLDKLGVPTTGTMAYVRAMPLDLIHLLCRPDSVRIPGWRVLGVTDEHREERGTITADQAVDLREGKVDAVLLLVEPRLAGAGMDGIYSAVREITEEVLTEAALRAARASLPRELRLFVERAIAKASRLDRLNAISGWHKLLFCARCAASPETAGGLVAELGLWPIDTSGGIVLEDLDMSVQIVNRLLLRPAGNRGASSRVESLLLSPECAATAGPLLEALLREHSGEPWIEVVRASGRDRRLWLHVLQPDFGSQSPREIRLEPWRKSPSDKPSAWSGLRLKDQEGLELLLDSEHPEKIRLEIRWRTEPEDLPKGSVDYQVSLRTISGAELTSVVVKHTERTTQKAVFRQEEFSDLEDGNAWQVRAVVHPVGYEPTDEDSLLCRESEEFVARYGEAEPDEKVGAGKKARALVDEAIRWPVNIGNQVLSAEVTEDKSHFIGVRVQSKTIRVFRPPVLRAVEESWQAQGFVAGRWRLVVRPDGTAPEPAEFVPLERGECPEDLWKKAQDASSKLGEKAMARRGFLGLVLWKEDLATAYVNAWTGVLERGAAPLALIHTLEVRSQAGRILGLIVLPWHPLRVAWHQAYDELAYHVCYEEKLTFAEASRALQLLDGSRVPSYLPGSEPGQAFVFGDMLGFHAVAMISDGEPEPQAVIAQLVACLAPRSGDLVPSVNISTAEAIARELDRYIDLHEGYHLLRLHALRPGDGLTLVKSLDRLIQERRRRHVATEDEDGEASDSPMAFRLRLYPAPSTAEKETLGRYLVHCAERRRSGVESGADDYRWMNESIQAGGLRVPLLEWSKDTEAIPVEPAHVSVGFDSFSSTVEAVDETSLAAPRPLEAFGLIPTQIRSFTFFPTPTWTESVAVNCEGEKHPANRVLTERLLRVTQAVNRLTGRHLAGGAGWPQVRTNLSADQADALRRLHELSDWVVTVDRNAGIEYFDSPREATDVFDTYVIDCVPERRDLDAVQLVTSTCQIDEVLNLLNDTLHDLQLSRSPRNAAFLLGQLKSLSGRMVMRLVGQSTAQGEMIGLAMVVAHFKRNQGADGPWLSLQDGFLVPLDDVRELLFPDGSKRIPEDTGDDEGTSRLRADMVYVSVGPRNALSFTFVEVKFRRLLRSAMDAGLWERILEQLTHTRRRWESTYFGEDLSPTVKALRRKRLVRALRFYLERGRRHQLREDVYLRLSDLLDRLLRSDFERTSVIVDRGYVFCPEYQGTPAEIASEPDRRIWIFGPQNLPDAVVALSDLPTQPIEPEGGRDSSGPPTLPEEGARSPVYAGEAGARTSQEPGDASAAATSASQPVCNAAAPLGAGLVLGHRVPDGESVRWNLSIRGNPHLMIVGLPGMGKTTTILSLVQQLLAAGIAPMVFCYHDDIEAKLRDAGVTLNLVDMEHGLGFNPLRVVGGSRHSWLDNVGMLRDMFAALFPDLGDLQTNEIREAIKTSYLELGYSLPEADPARLAPPPFQRFFDVLRQAKKPNHGLLARLSELNDYGFFSDAHTRPSLLDSNEPTLVRLYTNQNMVLQNALSSFILLNVYQNMFLRGAQPGLTHAVIFDEAHRASRLRLLPTMAKECRKYGLSLVVASQEAKDFHPSLFAAIANYLTLRVTEIDAKALARNVPSSAEGANLAERLKELPKFHAWFCQEGGRPAYLKLRNF